MPKIILSVLLIFCFALNPGSSQSAARCFSFTWLGPRFNNGSVFMNATCSEATRLAAGVPCFEPLVVSYDGTRPDTDYIWMHHADQASCILANTDVCATYSYFFNGMVENVTHMCTRVEEAMGTPITNGCYETVNNNWRTRACFCRSVAGGVPCNHARAHGAAALLIVAAALGVYVRGIV